MAEKKAAAKRGRATSARARQESEEVPASEINVGETVFFPNSRRSQPVEQIVDDEQDGKPVRRFIADEGKVSWLVAPDTPIKREA